jgi:hypothetical protein
MKKLRKKQRKHMERPRNGRYTVVYTFLTSVEWEIRAADVKLFLLLRGLFPSVLTQHTDWPVRGIARSIHTGIQE